MQVRHRPILTNAIQWFKIGDHPCDESQLIAIGGQSVLSDGKIVRRYYNVFEKYVGQCHVCGVAYNDHGKMDTSEGMRVVCPGDWIVEGIDGTYHPINPALFIKLYENYEGT